MQFIPISNIYMIDSSIKFRCMFPLILAASVLACISCKKDSAKSTIETTSGENTLFVEVDGKRYQPKKFLFEMPSGNKFHNGVEFTTMDKNLSTKRQNFKLAEMFSFQSEAVLSGSVWSKVNFGMSNIFANFTTDINSLLSIAKGDYDMGDYRDEGKHHASISYTLSNNSFNWSDVRTYSTKKGTGKLSITQLTDKIISGKIEGVVETGNGNSYDSKKITLYFDYTMNTINNKIFD